MYNIVQFVHLELSVSSTYQYCYLCFVGFVVSQSIFVQLVLFINYVL